MIEHLHHESSKQKDEIDKLKRKMAKMKTAMSEKDKTIAKQRNVFRDMRTLREKHKYSEKERL